MAAATHDGFQLHYRSLFDPGRGFSFPCDGRGQVDLDGLSERARNNYLYARAVVGRELAWPDITRCLTDSSSAR